MENGKSPEINGVFKENFHLFKKDLQETFNKIIFQTKITPTTWKQAIITLIPKQTEKIKSLKYWRTISLL